MKISMRIIDFPLWPPEKTWFWQFFAFSQKTRDIFANYLSKYKKNDLNYFKICFKMGHP